MNRREFLQRIGVGSLAAGSIPLLARPAIAHLKSDRGNQRHFRFVALSFLPTEDDTPSEAIVMEGTGIFDRQLRQANGDFQHITWPPPSSLLGHGLWKRKRDGAFDYQKGFGSFAEIEASILTIEIRMLPRDTGTDPFTAMLRIVCNVGPAGLLTGENEGFTLTLPDGTTFQPAVPAVGLTHISTKH
jgi:hypothetical protein